MVTLQFNRPDSVLTSQQETLVKELQTIVNAATVQVVVDTIRPLPDNWYIVQRYIILYINCTSSSIVKFV